MTGKELGWIISLACIAVLMSAVAGCSAWKQRDSKGADATQAAAAVYRTISPAEAEMRLREEKDIVLLDVRTQPENAEKRIPGSLLLPLDRLEMEASSVLPDKKAVIFIYCRSGNRSRQAANILLRLGYTRVYDLGGIIDWPYATESGS